MCLTGIPILSYKQGFLRITDILIAVSHFKNCFRGSFVEEIDHALHKRGFRQNNSINILRTWFFLQN